MSAIGVETINVPRTTLAVQIKVRHSALTKSGSFSNERKFASPTKSRRMPKRFTSCVASEMISCNGQSTIVAASRKLGRIRKYGVKGRLIVPLDASWPGLSHSRPVEVLARRRRPRTPPPLGGEARGGGSRRLLSLALQEHVPFEDGATPSPTLTHKGGGNFRWLASPRRWPGRARP